MKSEKLEKNEDLLDESIGTLMCDLKAGDLIFNASAGVFVLKVTPGFVTFMSLFGCKWEGIKIIEHNLAAVVAKDYKILRYDNE